MTVYVVEIEGRGIAAFYAENGAAAMVRVRDPLFRDDLMVLATDGLPLWDGMADIQVRPAFPEEEVKWHASRAKAIRHGNIEREDDTWITFLVALTDLDRRRGSSSPSRGAPIWRLYEPETYLLTASPRSIA